MRGPMSEEQRAVRREQMQAAWASGRFANRRRGMHPRHWTPEQNRAFTALAGTMPIAEIADALERRFLIRRTTASLRIQAKRLGISLWSGGYGLGELERIFKLDHRAIVRNWVNPGLLAGKRWKGRGPNEGWWFEPSEVERFVRECGWAYDVRTMLPGHRLTRLAELAHKVDPWLTYQDLMCFLGIKGQVNLDRWRERGLIPHKRRAKSGPGQRIVVRGRDFPAIKAAIEEARAAAREANRVRFMAMRRGQLERAS